MRRQIKQREQAERALNDQFEFMRALVNGSPHPIYVRDREGLLRMCNDSYLKAFDAQREDVLDKGVTEGVLVMFSRRGIRQRLSTGHGDKQPHDS